MFSFFLLNIPVFFLGLLVQVLTIASFYLFIFPLFIIVLINLTYISLSYFLRPFRLASDPQFLCVNITFRRMSGWEYCEPAIQQYCLSFSFVFFSLAVGYPQLKI